MSTYRLMNAGGVSMELEGFGELLADLKTLQRNVTEHELLEASALRVHTRQMKHFDEARDSGGAAWKPLHPLTRMLRRGGGAKPLQDTGLLKRSIRILSVWGEGYEIGTNLVYAAVQQFGAFIRPRSGTHLAIGVNKHGAKARTGRTAKSFIFLKSARIPAREYLYLNDQELRDEAEYMVEDATQGTKAIKWDGARYGGLQ